MVRKIVEPRNGRLESRSKEIVLMLGMAVGFRMAAQLLGAAGLMCSEVMSGRRRYVLSVSFGFSVGIRIVYMAWRSDETRIRKVCT